MTIRIVHNSHVHYGACSIHILYKNVQAHNGEHFVGYNQVVNVTSYQRFAISIPAFALFSDLNTSDHTETLSFLTEISHTTCDWHLSGSNTTLVYIDQGPIDSSQHDVLTFYYTTTLAKKDLIPHLFILKQQFAEILGVARKTVLLGRILSSQTPRRLASSGVAALPMKVLASKGGGDLLMQKLKSADFGSLIVQGSLSNIR